MQIFKIVFSLFLSSSVVCVCVCVFCCCLFFLPLHLPLSYILRIRILPAAVNGRDCDKWHIYRYIFLNHCFGFLTFAILILSKILFSFDRKFQHYLSSFRKVIILWTPPQKKQTNKQTNKQTKKTPTKNKQNKNNII